MNRLVLTTLLALAGVSALSGCRGQVSEEPPIVPIRNMYDQPRYDPQEGSDFFQDGRTMRPLVEGTVAREMETDLSVESGRTEDGSAWLLEVPGPVLQRQGGMEQALTRGHERFDIYCAPCHGVAGDGAGLVSQRANSLGFSALIAPTLHDGRLRQMPDGQLFATITNGIRNMPAYGHNIPLDDRWAIVTYVRALQISQASRPTAMNVEAAQ
ncbi:MAG: cytochrome c [Sandaracinus sp.]|nr:cytochrome c [Sandaracinus sp.]MCB9612532.1 cytochrome c [Sandaracinus sp.]MCB9633017.1 cytochrome c [Sandaracinus sp.]